MTQVTWQLEENVFDDAAYLESDHDPQSEIDDSIRRESSGASSLSRGPKGRNDPESEQ